MRLLCLLLLLLLCALRQSSAAALPLDGEAQADEQAALLSLKSALSDPGQQKEDMNPILLEFAKLDFNLVQSIYTGELKQLSSHDEVLL